MHTTLSPQTTLHGTITRAQERRFCLVDERGVTHLLVLDSAAPVDPRALRLLAASGERVRVSCRDNPSDVDARVAVDIRPIEGTAG